MLITVLLSCLACLVFVIADTTAAARPEVTVTDDWQVQVTTGDASVTLAVAPAEMITVNAEHYESLPLFNAGDAGWVKGTKLRGVTTQETSAMGYLDPASVVVAPAPAGTAFVRDRDYAIDLEWGTFGRLADGHIGAQQPVYVSYRHGVGRIDSVICQDGQVTLRSGRPCINVPEPRRCKPGKQSSPTSGCRAACPVSARTASFPYWRQPIRSPYNPRPHRRNASCRTPYASCARASG